MKKESYYVLMILFILVVVILLLAISTCGKTHPPPPPPPPPPSQARPPVKVRKDWYKEFIPDYKKITSQRIQRKKRYGKGGEKQTIEFQRREE